MDGGVADPFEHGAGIDADPDCGDRADQEAGLQSHWHIQKLPTPVAIQYVLIFIANVGVMAVVAYVLQKYFREEQIRTKRSFEPKSLIGAMQVSDEGTMY